MAGSGRDRRRVITIAAFAATALAFAALAFARRWMSDDGLIAVRTVRQLLAGHGPTFNGFERAEANTSTLWTYAIALVAWVTRADVATVAVALGWVLGVAAIPIAMDGTRRWHRARGEPGAVVPFGILVAIGIYPFWDFATSGLETGMCWCWLAAAWWLLVVRGASPRLRVQLGLAVWFGLGPLVRPDLAIGSICFFAAQLVLVRPLRYRRILLLIAAAAALPVAYEVFRAGYYGALVPLPALAKSAAGAAWLRGARYLLDFARPYWVVVPIGLAIGHAIAGRRAPDAAPLARADLVIAAAPIATGVVMALFVVRVGGDFMHARMFLAPLLAALLPCAVVPLGPRARYWIVAMAMWAVAIAWLRGDGERHTSAHMVEDERQGYAVWAKADHPMEADYARADGKVADAVARAAGRRRFLSEGGIDVPMNPALPGDLVLASGRLGTGGSVASIDAIVADKLGLANPLGARITPTKPGITGHEKSLPTPWLLADFADPDADLAQARTIDIKWPFTDDAVRAARHAMTCGAIAELRESVRAPLTWSRFWANVTGAPGRTQLEIPSDPFDAEAQFCAPGTLVARRPLAAFASSSHDADGWNLANVVDGVRESRPGSYGFSTGTDGAPQWLAIDLGRWQIVRRVSLYPRTDPPLAGLGLPIDFELDVWSGAGWAAVVVRSADTHAGTDPDVIDLPAPIVTSAVRIYATKLPLIRAEDGVRLQLSEVVVE